MSCGRRARLWSWGLDWWPAFARSTSAAGRVASSISSPSGSHPAGWWSGGHSRRTLRADLVQSLRPHILEMGLANEGELNELDAAARTHFDDPDTVVMPGLMFLAWGRKPTTA